MCDYIDMPSHLLGESRYEPNGTPTAAQHCVAPDGCAFLHNRLVQGVRPYTPVRFSEPHPWNRITIPRRCALFCATVDAPFNSSNRGC
jgi:hypothetical protein